MFLIIKDVDFASYADDNTPYVTEESVEQVKSRLENTVSSLFQWFKDNEMRANANKCHFLVSSKETAVIEAQGNHIENSQFEKLLGITFDTNLTFNLHLNQMCKTASQKLNAIARVIPQMCLHKRKTVIKSFFMSLFNYCPLVWMCHNRSYNNRINQLHERSLRMVYNDKWSSFEDLLRKDGSVSIHVKNIQVLMTEMYKVKNNLAPILLSEVFKLKPTSTYNLRTVGEFEIRRVRTTNFGTESLSFLGPKLWNTVPLSIRNVETLKEFKSKIRYWIPESCPCRLCRNYVQNLGYI